MSEYYGPGVSRTLSAIARQFAGMVFQKGRPPLDAEHNLTSEISTEQLAQAIRAEMHSGWLLDPTQATADYVTDAQWSNLFYFGRQADGEEAPIQYANVNGWIIPVTGTGTADGDTSNRVSLNPPPASDARIDLVFLEAWATLIAPNPSEVNKPTVSTIWRYGNVEFGGTNVTDDLEDPTIGFETTLRVQVQYRIRVFGAGAGFGSSVALDVYPDGIDDPNVLGQGTSTEPVAGMLFTNMRDELGDPSLWRAGDGDPTNDLGTVDGYVYALPMAAVFRRNSSTFQAVFAGGAANQNGGLDRNPSAASLPVPREGAKELSTPVLTSTISEDAGASASANIAVTNLADSGFDDPDIDLPSTFIVIDDEIIGPLTAVGASTVTVAAGSRGRYGTQAVPHDGNAVVRFFNLRPDGLFADQVASTDILDLRRGVTAGDWDYQRILVSNLSKLVQGTLRTSYKQSAASETEGVQVVEASYMLAGSAAVPPSSMAVDGTDGIRTVFSDSSGLQPGVTVLCDTPAGAGAVAAFDTGVEWDVAAGFNPSGFATAAGFANGTTIFLNIGGSTGTAGARTTFRNTGVNAVRFVSPAEYWKTSFPDDTTGLQTPLTIRFLGAAATSPGAPSEEDVVHPGPMYPLQDTNFESPFIVLGGVLNAASSIGGVTLVNDSPGAGEYEIQLPGLNFDTAGGWYPTGSLESLDPSGITFPVLRGQRTLYDLLTRGGQDQTGRSSEVYVVLYGDSTNPDNCGAFQVLGAGTVGYTTSQASAADRIRVRFLSAGVTQFTLPSAGSITAEMRTQYTNAEDGAGGSATPPASLAIVWTDIQGRSGGSPWEGLLPPTVAQKMVISSTLQYHPGRGAMARVPDSIWRIAGVGLGAEYLRQAPGSQDLTFVSATGVPSNETYFDVTHVQTWNRLPSLGLSAPNAPSYGGGIAASSEQTRESEAFIDRGSKSLIFRPFLDRSMTLQGRTSRADVADTLIGVSTYPGPVPAPGTVKDGAGIWTTGLHLGFEVPPEFMPRFGRQDIPYCNVDGTGTFLPGINHLFTDSQDVLEAQSYVIGGQDSTSTAILPLYVQTGASSGLDYCEYGNIAGSLTDAYQGQIVDLTNVISSDLGRGMKGIQLPPYVGIARLYGVYDLRDYNNNGGATFNADRVTSAGGATNLLRTDATKQTLFILQGGGEEATGDADDHTYIVPENAINIELSPRYVDGETFEDIEYVVEICAFGFARGFINKNNYVLCRRHKGSVTAIVDSVFASAMATVTTAPLTAGDTIVINGVTLTGVAGTRTSGSNDFDVSGGSVTLVAAEIAAAINDTANDFSSFVTAEAALGIVSLRAVVAGVVGNAITLASASGGRIMVSGGVFSGGLYTEPEAEGARMTIPAPAPADALYIGTSRTPYQGDPYMTRAGATRTASDYTYRYGQVPIASQFHLTSSIQQYTTAGELIPETPNRRSLQILAAVDFYTTLGTGKIGGTLYPGTPLDVGHTENTPEAAARLPDTSSSPAWRVVTRAFSEGQRSNASQARIVINVYNNTALSGAVSFQIPGRSPVSLIAGTDFAVGGTATITATNLAAAINANNDLQPFMRARSNGTTAVTVSALMPGAAGNQLRVELSTTLYMELQANLTTESVVNLTQAYFSGGVDVSMNGGSGTSQLDLTGMTERLPLGILLQDSDFLCENPLNDTSSAMATQPQGIRPVQSLLPLTEDGQEYTRFLSGPGQWVALADGGILEYEAYNATSAPTGTRKFRLFRGGGSAFMVSDPTPGGPIDWVSGSFPANLSPVLKGGVLICKALLVRNLPEEAFSPAQATSQGDEVQLLVLTYGHLGDGSTQVEGVNLSGVISPTGYGEGYAAADRYRLEGRPMVNGRARALDTADAEPAVYPGDGAEPL